MTDWVTTQRAGWDAVSQRCVFVLITAAAALVPLETFVLTQLARTGVVPDRMLFYLQFAIEGAVYLALGWTVMLRLVTGGGIRRTPIDLPLLVILAIVTLSIAVNHAPLKGSLLNLRSALRYTAVFYLVTQAGLTRGQIGVVLRVILISGTVQVFVGLLQWQGGLDLKVLMLPYAPDVELAGQARRFVLIERGREYGSLFGTLEDTLYYGLYMVVLLTVALSRDRRWRAWYLVDVVAILFVTAYSYSRASVIAVGLALLAYAGGRLGKRRVVGACCLLAALGMASVGGSLVLATHGESFQNPRLVRHSILSNMTSIFSVQYLERSKRQRLGAVLGVAPTLLMNAPILGFGPDQHHVIARLNEARDTRLYKTLGKEGFEDVYWVALLCYTGLLGVAAVAWLGVRLAWTCAAVARGAGGDPVLRWAGLAGLCIVLQAAVLMWFNRVPEIRSFSFFLWLLPALAYAEWTAKQSEPAGADEVPAPGCRMS